ncbi:IMP cyclohydrolase [Fumia xinanensis]|uniref:IMP cyclohydrolase n=1 Tax=Fumia xinanensis TaxID=2763659 RepID=A0A926E7C3_9FIRM|nr:IMP cyclohydrolase [Fumia xinanensis]MBC8560516.1 IMP cyclohydrolase [Fumia xinanensis]
MIDMVKDLQQNSYPGRGIVLGRSSGGEHAVIGYFIMGRSENSRNRIFVEEQGGIRTEAFDPAKLSDPSLIIYWPVRVLGDQTIVTNGDQTDTIYDYLKDGKTFADALRTRTFEPDGPNFTPRISGLVEKNGDYRLSILKSNEGDPDSAHRYFYEYQNPKAGQAHFIHTYEHDGDPIPSFVGEPKQVKIEGCIECFTKMLWENLNEENKVSLFTRFINLKTGKTETRIINKNVK